MLEPQEKSLIRGSHRLARRAKPRELAKEQALRMFVGWARRKSGKKGPRGAGTGMDHRHRTIVAGQGKGFHYDGTRFKNAARSGSEKRFRVAIGPNLNPRQSTDADRYSFLHSSFDPVYRHE